MNYEYFQHWVEMTRNFQQPLQQLTELHLKTLKDLSYITPEELASIKIPEELMEKHVHVTIENSHKALNYMEKSFEIIEDSLLTLIANPGSKIASEFKKMKMNNPFLDALKTEKKGSPVLNLATTMKKETTKTAALNKKMGKKMAQAQSTLAKKASSRRASTKTTPRKLKMNQPLKSKSK